MRRAILPLAIGAACMAGLLAAPAPAEAQPHGRPGWHGHHRHYRAPPHAYYPGPRAYYPPPVYYAPPPVYYAPPPAYVAPGFSFGFNVPLR